jgi:feruloyl esterase
MAFFLLSADRPINQQEMPMSNDHKHKQVLSIVFTAALVGCGGGDGDGGNAGNVRVDGGRTAAATAEQCQALASKVLPNVEITLATAVTGGSFLPPDASAEVNEAPAFCRFAGTATPTADSEIKFEVWMPLQGWNGKFVQAGNGGYGRGFNQPVTGMLPALKRGYAVAGTDMGHPVTVGYDASWAEGHPEKVVDWAYRAVHETAKTSKEVISSLYNGAPSRS